MLAKVISAAVIGLDAYKVDVEVDIPSQGLPSFTIVGLPDKAVEESKERVRSAIKNSGADFPAKRITVNLAPADIPKEGPSYDLAIALGILIASGQISPEIEKSLFIGELSLDGSLRSTNGVLPKAIFAKENHFENIFVPSDNAEEARYISGVNIYSLTNLGQLVKHLSGLQPLDPEKERLPLESAEDYGLDMKDVKGQENAKRALEIAAAGGHNVILKGPPGSGKTLLARTFPSILPRLNPEESIEISKIYSVVGLLKNKLITARPFRSPHHSSSHVGLVGGGTHPKPGEISLAHRGVLFLDEFPEFARHTLEVLRQPLEDGFVTVSRAAGSSTFPAKFILLAAANPCPCGYLNHPRKDCVCTPSQVVKYKKRISGPILDRIDLHIDVPDVQTEKLALDYQSEPSSQIRSMVQKARERQWERFEGTPVSSNSEMSNKEVKEFAKLTKDSLDLVKGAIDKFSLSARSFFRILKVARTIADLEGIENIKTTHLAEALQYRLKDNF